MKNSWVNRFTVVALVFLVAITSACGYILYPERHGQTQGRVDPAVVALDAASLLFGIVPGIIAFAVDLSTGAIYLPPGEANVIEKHGDRLSSSFGVPTQLTDLSQAERKTIADNLAALTGGPIDQHAVRYYEVTGQQPQQLYLRRMAGKTVDGRRK